MPNFWRFKNLTLLAVEATLEIIFWYIVPFYCTIFSFILSQIILYFFEILNYVNREKGVQFSVTLLHLKFHLLCFLSLSGWKFPKSFLFCLFFFKCTELFINCMVIFSDPIFVLIYFYFQCVYFIILIRVCIEHSSFIFILSYLIMRTFKSVILVRVWVC